LAGPSRPAPPLLSQGGQKAIFAEKNFMPINIGLGKNKKWEKVFLQPN
jgi:hypothetical protein